MNNIYTEKFTNTLAREKANCARKVHRSVTSVARVLVMPSRDMWRNAASFWLRHTNQIIKHEYIYED